MAHSDGVRRGLSAWALVTRGELARHTERSLGLGTRDTWRARAASEGVSRCGLSGHVAHSEGSRGVALRVGFRDKWHSQKVSGGWLSVWASGTRGTHGKFPGKV